MSCVAVAVFVSARVILKVILLLATAVSKFVPVMVTAVPEPATPKEPTSPEVGVKLVIVGAADVPITVKLAELVADPSLAQKLLSWKAKRSLNEIIASAWNWAQKRPS